MTYKAPLETSKEKFKESNYRLLEAGKKLRCHRCNGIHWRVFYNAFQCMGCRSWTAFEMAHGGDLRSIFWVAAQMADETDGRVFDPISKRSEFVIYDDRLTSRISGTDLMFGTNEIKATWLLRAWPQKKPRVLKGKEIVRLMKS